MITIAVNDYHNSMWLQLQYMITITVYDYHYSIWLTLEYSITITVYDYWPQQYKSKCPRQLLQSTTRALAAHTKHVIV